jgi:Holliday junction resolvasome RuvABC endonuclease subunit
MKIIGIDPDSDKCGVCIISNGYTNLHSIKIEDVLSTINLDIEDGYIFAVENVEANKTTYPRGVPAKAHAAIAQKVGMVKMAARVIIRTIQMHGGIVILVPPGVGKQVKNNAKLFNELSGWTERSNEDMRDAWAIAQYALNKK